MKLLRTFSLTALIVLMAGIGAHADALKDAVTAHAAGQFATAIPLYQTAIQQGNAEQRKQAEFLLAGCYWSDQQLDDAASEFLTYAKDFPGDGNTLTAIVHAADIRLHQGDLTDAATLLNQVFSKGNPNGSDAYAWLGWANLAEGQLQAAQKNYTQAVPYLLNAIQNASEGRVVGLADDCLQQCDSALEAAGKQPMALKWQGESGLDEGRWLVAHEEFSQAQAPLQTACTNLTVPGALGEAQVLLARTYVEAKDWLACLSKASAGEQTLLKDPQAAQRYPGTLADAYTYQARADLELKDYQKCVDQCEAMRASVPSADADRVAGSYLLETKALLNTGQVEEGLAKLLAKAKLQPGHSFSTMTSARDILGRICADELGGNAEIAAGHLLGLDKSGEASQAEALAIVAGYRAVQGRPDLAIRDLNTMISEYPLQTQEIAWAAGRIALTIPPDQGDDCYWAAPIMRAITTSHDYDANTQGTAKAWLARYDKAHPGSDAAIAGILENVMRRSQPRDDF